MHHHRLSLLCAGLLASVVNAQCGIAWLDADPNTAGQQNFVQSTYFTGASGTTTQPTLGDILLPSPIFRANSTDRRIVQVSMGKTGVFPLGAGEYHLAMTVFNLHTFYGSLHAGQSVIMGKVTWNSGSPVFTPNTMANNMNTSATTFGLMIDGKDGTRAAVDWGSGPRWSKRLAPSFPFPQSVPLTGAGGSYVDPAPGHVDGVLGAFWVDSSTTMSWAPVLETMTGGNLTGAVLDTANAIVVITTTLEPTRPHSPTPLFGAGGDANGMFFSRKFSTNNDSDQYFSGQIPDATAGTLIWNNGAWINNGGNAGSRFLAANSGNYSFLIEGRGYSLTTNSNITVQAGATLDISIRSPVGTPPLFSTTLGVSLGLGPVIPLPGILGALCLDTNLLALIVGGPTGNSADEIATQSFPATDNSLKGVTLNLQAVTVPIGGQPGFTNSASPFFKN